MLITRGTPAWENIAGEKTIAPAWLVDEDKIASQPGTRIYRIGQGRICVVDETAIPAYLSKVVFLMNEALERNAMSISAKRGAPLNGFDGKPDQIYSTDFPSGRLIYHAQAFTTEFVPRTDGVAIAVEQLSPHALDTPEKLGIRINAPVARE